MWREHNVTTIKKVGGKYKVCNLNMIHGGTDEKNRKSWGESETKMDNNIARARTAVKEIALCNPWEWFVTLTINPDKLDRYDLDGYHKKLGRFIVDQNKRRDPDRKITYILVPEKHQDGAWHMHGLIHGITVDDDLYTNEHGYLSWRPYEKSFGYLSISHIKHREKCINYVCKYVAKTLALDVQGVGSHLYYRSRGLKEPELIYRGKVENPDGWQWSHPEGFMRLSVFDDIQNLNLIDFAEESYKLDELYAKYGGAY